MFFFFFFNDTATTEIYTLSLHDALPISDFPIFLSRYAELIIVFERLSPLIVPSNVNSESGRSEEHTSELQSRLHLVCRLLLEKKKKELKRSKTDIMVSPREHHTIVLKLP